jgi:hypothetical protein
MHPDSLPIYRTGCADAPISTKRFIHHRDPEGMARSGDAQGNKKNGLLSILCGSLCLCVSVAIIPFLLAGEQGWA